VPMMTAMIVEKMAISMLVSKALMIVGSWDA
jgi:hypothetical protein